MVSTHCTRDVVTGQRHEPLAEAAQRMRDRHVGDLVIVDNQEDRTPVGMLTDRDIVVGPVAQAAEHFNELTIGDVMSTPAITVRESDDLDSALSTMQSHGVRRMPVIDRTGSLCGLLAVDDVIRHVTAELGKLVTLQATGEEREFVRRP
ncbi:MAG: CBS domain-containing protein [Vicinamibacterales bacterium]|nr:CBS domain-containing protein [Vicinamibacterales bacterium]MDP7692994.1 CBS domain-containing protein [Vicinamibacterales bacterium]HJN44496.1 CBS domain-containing protein [Vicinamibacterales bacterium]